MPKDYGDQMCNVYALILATVLVVAYHEDLGADQFRLHARAAKYRLQVLMLCLCLCYGMFCYGWRWKREWDEMKRTSLCVA